MAFQPDFSIQPAARCQSDSSVEEGLAAPAAQAAHRSASPSSPWELQAARGPTASVARAAAEPQGSTASRQHDHGEHLTVHRPIQHRRGRSWGASVTKARVVPRLSSSVGTSGEADLSLQFVVLRDTFQEETQSLRCGLAMVADAVHAVQPVIDQEAERRAQGEAKLTAMIQQGLRELAQCALQGIEELKTDIAELSREREQEKAEKAEAKEKEQRALAAATKATGSRSLQSSAGKSRAVAVDTAVVLAEAKQAAEAEVQRTFDAQEASMHELRESLARSEALAVPSSPGASSKEAASIIEELAFGLQSFEQSCEKQRTGVEALLQTEVEAVARQLAERRLADQAKLEVALAAEMEDFSKALHESLQERFLCELDAMKGEMRTQELGRGSSVQELSALSSRVHEEVVNIEEQHESLTQTMSTVQSEMASSMRMSEAARDREGESDSEGEQGEAAVAALQEKVTALSSLVREALEAERLEREKATEQQAASRSTMQIALEKQVAELGGVVHGLLPKVSQQVVELFAQQDDHAQALKLHEDNCASDKHELVELHRFAHEALHLPKLEERVATMAAKEAQLEATETSPLLPEVLEASKETRDRLEQVEAELRELTRLVQTDLPVDQREWQSRLRQELIRQLDDLKPTQRHPRTWQASESHRSAARGSRSYSPGGHGDLNRRGVGRLDRLVDDLKPPPDLKGSERREQKRAAARVAVENAERRCEAALTRWGSRERLSTSSQPDSFLAVNSTRLSADADSISDIQSTRRMIRGAGR
eukprot:TRINITY_DN36588_c0_g2_i2.p1 TRINITY_DN36588_c0_g2~~TRINITY_DN36588_c0_g2_i2.p1  ORF type:complete len:787 (+),score=207.49 TRINITY_DN36588_c0_g2_i2:47-2362(+)